MSQPQKPRGAPHTLDDYLGCHGLDHEGVLDPMTGQRAKPTWQPIEDSGDFGGRVVERFREWRTALEKNGLLETWRRNYRQYFNGPSTPGTSDEGWGWDESFQLLGENGEVLGVRVSEARNLLTHMKNLACAKPVVTRAVAEDATPESIEAAQIADSTVREDFNPTNGWQLISECVELALAITCGFIDPEWDIFAGEAYVPTEDGQTYYTGKPKMSVRMPDEVCFDLTKRKWDDVEQVIVLQRANRYLLASQFPDKAEAILSQPSLDNSEFPMFRYSDEQTDDIVILRYMHKAGNKRFLPEGRLGLVLEDGTVLRDGSNPYALVDPTKIGIFPIVAGSGLGTVYGYATMNDLSPLKQWLDVMATMAATIIVGYGAPNLTGPNMNSAQVQMLVGGGRYFSVPSGQGEVKPLNLLDGPAMKALLEVMQLVMQLGEKHSGMNSVIRGEGGDHSGKYVALVKSMAVQFMTGLQQSIVATCEQLGTYLIRMRQAFSTAQETADLQDGQGGHMSVPYKASEVFPRVARVRAEAVDPIWQTTEGRQMLADKLLEQGAFPSPNEYVTMIKTGRDEPLYKRPMSTNTLIQRENRMIQQGQVPKVLVSDLHDLHEPEHDAVGDNPEVRENEKVIQAKEEHVAMHRLARMGVPFQQGIGPDGVPYPSATEQWSQFQAQQQMAQQGPPGPGGPPQGGPPSAPQGGPPPGPPQKQGPPPGPQQPMTAADSLQQAAMGPM